MHRLIGELAVVAQQAAEVVVRCHLRRGELNQVWQSSDGSDGGCVEGDAAELQEEELRKWHQAAVDNGGLVPKRRWSKARRVRELKA